MLKRMLYGGGAVGILSAAYLLGSVSLGGAFAQTSPAPAATATTQVQTARAAQPPPAPAAPAANEPAGAGGQDNASEQAESAALASQAKLSVDQANAAALARFPGATIKKTDLGNENGTLAYDVQLTDSSGKSQEVKVDATTGAVLSAQADTPEAPGAPEAPDAGGETD